MKACAVAVILATLAEGGVTDGWGSSTRATTRSPKPGGKTFSLAQIANKNFSGPDGAMAFMRAHMKYAQQLPVTVLKAVNANPELRMKFAALSQGGGQKGTAEARPTRDTDSEYAVMVSIGTPPQAIPLNFDTGSADFWTFSSDTPSNMVRGQTIYRPENSSTSQLLDGERWSVKYGDGAGASGIVYQDIVRIGDTYVEKQAIESAIRVSEDIADDTFVSGIVGLSNSAANTVRPTSQRTYIDNIHDDLAMPLFTVNLRAGAPGNYNFGYIDDSEHKGRVQYTPVDRHSALWMIKTSGYWVGNTPHREAINAIVDTGTSLALLPQSVVDKYYAQVRGSFLHPELGMMVFPCQSRLPDFWVRIGSYNGRLPGRFVNYAEVDFRYCFGGIQTSAGLPFSVLGDVFLKAQFVVFDYGNARVGFANKNLNA